jgi:hypothetical protein
MDQVGAGNVSEKSASLFECRGVYAQPDCTGVTAVAGMNLVVAAQTAVTFRLVFTVVTSGSEAVVIVRAAG